MRQVKIEAQLGIEASAVVLSEPSAAQNIPFSTGVYYPGANGNQNLIEILLVPQSHEKSLYLNTRAKTSSLLGLSAMNTSNSDIVDTRRLNSTRHSKSNPLLSVVQNVFSSGHTK